MDDYGADAPNTTALDLAMEVRHQLQVMNLQPTDIIPSAEGGVGFTFSTGARYADIEIFSGGRIAVITDDRAVEPSQANPTIWEVNATSPDIRDALVRIQKFLDE